MSRIPPTTKPPGGTQYPSEGQTPKSKELTDNVNHTTGVVLKQIMDPKGQSKSAVALGAPDPRAAEKENSVARRVI